MTTRTVETRDSVETNPSENVRSPRLLGRVFPGLLGALLYILNNLDVLHGWIAAPPGYAPLGIQRNADIAIYITWLRGYGKGWFLPNFSAPWVTSADFLAPGLMPVSLLQKVFSLSPIVALQIFSFVGYIFVAYAMAFAYKTFCSTHRQARWSLLVALACVPVGALPVLSYLLREFAQYGDTTGRVQFMTLSDGFFRGLVTWPFITYGSGFQILSMSLLARYLQTSAQKWFRWLTVFCLVSTLMHPFEIFLTTTVVAIVLVRKFGVTSNTVKNIGAICAAMAVGIAPYAMQSLRSTWVHEVANANRISITPALLMGVIGIPAIAVVLLLLLGFPTRRSDEITLLKTWFVCSLLLFFMPGIPFSLHVLDGSFIAIGLLLVIQIQDLLALRPNLTKPLVAGVALPLLLWSLIPHVLFRAQAWSAGVAPQNEQFSYDSCTTFHGTCLRPTAIQPLAESATIKWLGENANPDDLVLGVDDASPWIATAPVHSFASHWLFSLLWPYPNYRVLRNSFFSGTLTPAQGRQFLQILGVRFVVVPDGSRARQYLDNAVERTRYYSWTIYEIPGAHMRPYHDPAVLALGGGAN